MEMCPEVQSSPAIHASQQNRSILIDSSGAVAASLRGPQSRVTGGPHTQRVLPEYSSGLKNAQNAARSSLSHDDAETRMHLQP